MIQLENGQTMQIDPSTIDAVKSEEVTKMGGGSVLGVEQTQANTKQTSSLGSAIKLRKLPGGQQTNTAPAVAPAPMAPASGSQLGSEVVGKFERAFENVGIFEHKVTAVGPHSVRAELTADSEDKVFNALSATAFLLVRNAGVAGAQVDVVELFMKTTTGGSSGRFQMGRDDAQALDSKQITREEYFIRKVLF
jgi:hypothetical protein